MGRPLYKMTREGIKFIIENSGKLTFADMARHLHIDHTTVLYYVKKLKEKNIEVIPASSSQSRADKLIEDIINEKL